MKTAISKPAIAFLLMAVMAVAGVSAQSGGSNSSIAAVALYNSFRANKAKAYTSKVMLISGTATSVGPDPYALPSIELAEAKNKPSRVLCVLPFSDYLKLRHVSKGDQVVMQGEVRGFSKEHGYVVVKECKIVKVNGKTP